MEQAARVAVEAARQRMQRVRPLSPDTQPGPAAGSPAKKPKEREIMLIQRKEVAAITAAAAEVDGWKELEEWDPRDEAQEIGEARARHLQSLTPCTCMIA